MARPLSLPERPSELAVELAVVAVLRRPKPKRRSGRRRRHGCLRPVSAFAACAWHVGRAALRRRNNYWIFSRTTYVREKKISFPADFQSVRKSAGKFVRSECLFG